MQPSGFPPQLADSGHGRRQELRMQMIGQTIDARSPFSRWIVLYLAVAAALIVWAALIGSAHPLLAAALPLGIAIGLIVGRPQRIDLVVDNDEIQPLGTAEKVYFREISAITIGGREY